MISDSVPWRQQLWKSATGLRRRAQTPRWDEATAFRNERDLLIGMFAIRRLRESGKSSTLLPSRQVRVGVHPLMGRVPGRLDRWSYWTYYDVEARQRGGITFDQLCNAFIHSFILDFTPRCETSAATVWVVSDRDKARLLYSIPLPDVADLCERVATEYVFMSRDELGEPPLRLSQHDVVDAGLAEYDPYPDVDTGSIPFSSLASAFPALTGTRPFGRA